MSRVGRVVAVVLTGACLGLLGLPGLAGGPGRAAVGAARDAGRAGAAEPEAVRVLHEWDGDRARLLAQGDRIALRALYAAGQGRSDVALLDAYRRAGWRLRWMQTQTFAAATLPSAPGELAVRVTDRTLAGIAGHGRCRALPVSRPQAHVVRLRAEGGRWVVVSSRPVAGEQSAVSGRPARSRPRR